MNKKKIKEVKSTGFGSNVKNESDRLISKNGKFNIQKEGVTFFEKFNLFHALINMSTLPFFLCLMMGFIVLNLLFTGTYLIIGLENLQGTTTDNDFFDAFHFSAQTLTTVGYGGLYPTGKLISLVASFEAFIGLLGFAVSTGLLYGRFSKPKPKIMFSKNALISPYRDITGFMARVANPKNNQLINVTAKMMYSQIEETNGNKTRKFYPLDLEIDRISLFVTSWTIVHPITIESPLFNLKQLDIEKKKGELILLLSAYDESYSQDLHTRTSYKPLEIIENAKFKPVIGLNEADQSVIQLDKLDEYEHLK
jgi:inward rectifier potassium channel